MNETAKRTHEDATCDTDAQPKKKLSQSTGIPALLFHDIFKHLNDHCQATAGLLDQYWEWTHMKRNGVSLDNIVKTWQDGDRTLEITRSNNDFRVMCSKFFNHEQLTSDLHLHSDGTLRFKVKLTCGSAYCIIHDSKSDNTILLDIFDHDGVVKTASFFALKVEPVNVHQNGVPLVPLCASDNLTSKVKQETGIHTFFFLDKSNQACFVR